MSGVDDLRAFVEVVDRGSFRAAARSLGVTPPAVSKRVQALEHRLAAQLFRRTTRRLELTQAGRLFYDQVAAIPRLIGEAEESVRELSQRPRGRLRVAMPLYFAGAGLQYEVLPGFMARHPDVQLDITITGDTTKSLGEPFDVVVAGKFPGRRFPDTSLRSRPLFRYRTAVYAAPAYLEARGRPERPEDLRDHDCISYTNREWFFVEPRTGEGLFVPTAGPLTTDSNALLWAATMQGRGIAYSFPLFFDTELADGRVEAVLPEFTERAYLDVHVFHPPARYVPRRVRAFIDALVEHFGKHAS